MEEDLSLLLEFVGVFGGEVVCLTIFVATLLYLRMALKIVFEALCHIFALGKQLAD